MAKTTLSNLLTALNFVLRGKARTAGIDLSKVTIHEYVELDRTWGDKVGMVFQCEDKALELRCAEFARKWLTKNICKLTRTRDAQYGVDFQVNDWTGVHKTKTLTGSAIGYCYYPCND